MTTPSPAIGAFWRAFSDAQASLQALPLRERVGAANALIDQHLEGLALEMSGDDADAVVDLIVTAHGSGSPLSLVMIDLDHFKRFNDTHGHHVGDLLLQAVARRMQDCVRESDSVGRIGGDEFFILLPVIEHTADALTVAEKVRDALSRPFTLEDTQAIGISSSIGITLYPDHGDDTRLLYRYADQAMYRAKAQGRNQVQVFDTAWVSASA